MFSMCSELTPRARIPDTRIPQLMQPCSVQAVNSAVLPPSVMVLLQYVYHLKLTEAQ